MSNIYHVAPQEAQGGHPITDDLSPPAWWDSMAAPPVEDDDLDDNWFDYGDASPILWRGHIWCTTVHGAERIDGTHRVTFNDLWSVSAIKGALATEPNDPEDLKEALRVARMIDAYFVRAE